MTKASIYILPPLARVFTADTLPLAYEAPSPNIFSLTTDAFTTNGKLPPGLISICRWSLFLAPLKFTRIYYNFRLFFLLWMIFSEVVESRTAPFSRDSSTGCFLSWLWWDHRENFSDGLVHFDFFSYRQTRCEIIFSAHSAEDLSELIIVQRFWTTAFYSRKVENLPEGSGLCDGKYK